MKKNAAIIVLICIALVLVWLLLYQGKDHDSHKDDYKEVVTQRDSFNRYEAGALKVISGRDSIIKKKDSLINVLGLERAVNRKELDKSRAIESRLNGELKSAKRIDTSVFGQKVDSLINETDNLTYLLNDYLKYTDSIEAINSNLKSEMVSKDIERQRLYAELRRNNDLVNTKYISLFNDYKSARKDLKRERMKTKIAALLALIGGAAAVLK